MPRLLKRKRLRAILTGAFADNEVDEIIEYVAQWLTSCQKQAENDGASAAPEVIETLRNDLEDGCL
jgi:hypothetical protein